MADKYFDMVDAIDLMMDGHTTSVTNGDYDYYVIQDGVLFGMYSCNPKFYFLRPSELEEIKQGDWYLIS